MRPSAPLALLLLALAAGCGGAPPFPAGQVTIDGQRVELAALPVDQAVPADPQQAARWWKAWDARTDDPLRPWALARLDLLRPTPAAALARATLEELEPDPALTCLRDADLLIARWASGARASAAGLPGCSEEVPAGVRARAQLLLAVGLPRAAAEYDPVVAAAAPPGPERDDNGELLDAVDRRTLFRRGPGLLRRAIEATTPAEREEAIAELVHLSDAHVDRFALDDPARRWWEDGLDLDGDSAQVAALRRLGAVPGGWPEDVNEAIDRAATLASIAGALGDTARGLPAVRALHLEAWVLDAAGAPGGWEAWEALRDASSRWPTLRAAAVERLSQLAIRRGDLAVADALREEGEILVDRHRLTGLQLRLLMDRWRIDRRPALVGSRLTDLLEAHRLLRDRLDKDQVLSLQSALANAAYDAGWSPLARDVCLDATHLAERWNEPCRAVLCPAMMASARGDAQTLLAGLAETAAAGERCRLPGIHITTLAELALQAFRAGERQRAEEALAAALAASPPPTVTARADLEAARLADPEAGPSELDSFDRSIRAREMPRWNLDRGGAITVGYGHFISRQADEGATHRELLDLVARREGVRWLDGAFDRVPAEGADLLALTSTWDDDLLLAASWMHGGVTRQMGAVPARVLLDRAALESSRWVDQGEAPPEDGSIATLGSWTTDLGITSRGGPVLALGTGPGVAVPPSLLLVDGKPLGSTRATGLWVPTTPAPTPPTWRSGEILAARGRIGALGLLGIDELIAGAPTGWGQRVVSIPDEVVQAAEGADVLHISAHGHAGADGLVHLDLGPADEDRLDPEDLRTLDLQPGALVVLAACEAGGGRSGDLPMDLPMAAFQAGAGAVIFSRFPARARPLHEALGRLYAQLPFPCHELVERWHAIRVPYGVELLGIEVAVSTPCVPR